MQRPPWLGKALGGVFGFMATGGPFGALFGLFIGHLFDGAWKLRQFINYGMQGAQHAQQAFFRTTFRLMGHVAKCDGRISAQEIAATEQLMQRIGLSPAHRQEAIAHFREGSAAGFDIDAEIAGFMATAGAFVNLRQMMMMFLFTTAMADGALSGPEHDLLAGIARRLGFAAAEFEQMLRMFTAQEQFGGGQRGSYGPGANTLAAAYTALGIDENCSDADAKRAYRKLMSQYHPDKLIAEGVPEDMIKMATERAQEIQHAWEQVRKARGL